MKLETPIDLLERLRAQQGSSWYGLAGVLGTHKTTVANWKNGRTSIDRKFAIRIAELLNEPVEYVLACLEADREQDAELRKVWRRIAERFRSTAASILLAGLVGVGLGALPAQRVSADELSAAPSNVYYGKSRRKLWPWLKNKNGWPLPRPWTWARIRSTGSVLNNWSPSPVPT